MIPQRSDKKWELLVTGKIKHNFKCVPAGLMLSRVKREIQKDNSAENISKYIDEALLFFQRYETILQDDIKAIF